jgi:2-oxoglutarate dehydrogenase E2 component (dihydrolipoamide succinyltransferase)
VVIEREGMELIAVRTMMYLSLSFDHRLVDGALGGMYLERMVKYLQDFRPVSL